MIIGISLIEFVSRHTVSPCFSASRVWRVRTSLRGQNRSYIGRRKLLSKERGKQTMERSHKTVLLLRYDADYAFTSFSRPAGHLVSYRSCERSENPLNSALPASYAATSLPYRNSVPSIHMRCMITASLRATATHAFFIELRRATRMPQALRALHFWTRLINTWAAS